MRVCLDDRARGVFQTVLVVPLFAFIAVILIGTGLFYRGRSLGEQLGDAVGRLRARIASLTIDPEFKEEVKTTFVILAMLAVIPLLALMFAASRAVMRLLDRPAPSSFQALKRKPNEH